MEELNALYRLRDQVVVERFDDGALVLRLEDRHLIELNSTADYILAQIERGHSISQVAASLAETCEISAAEALEDAQSLCSQLSTLAIVELIVSGSMEGGAYGDGDSGSSRLLYQKPRRCAPRGGSERGSASLQSRHQPDQSG